MRIAVVHSFYSSRSPSGENTVVQEQVETLRGAGNEVHLVARYTDNEEKRPGYALRSGLTAASGWGDTPDDELTSFRPDVVHVHNTFPNLGTRWLRRWADRSVVTLHNYRTVCAAGTLFRDGVECTDCLRTPVLPGVRHRCYRGSRAATLPVAVGAAPGGGLRTIVRTCAAVVTLNDQMAAVLSSATSRPIAVIPNFVPKAPLGELAQPRRWAFVGRVAPEKGLDRLLSRWPETDLLDIFGGGPAADELERKYPNSRVRWRGLLPREALLDELGGYAGLLVPSAWSEGIPTVALEAIARGVPLGLSRQVAAGPTFVEGGAGRFLELDRTAEALHHDLERLSADTALRRGAQVLHHAHFSPEAWLSRIEPLYEQLIRDSPGVA